MQTRKPELKDFLQQVSGKEIYADFTDIDNTKMNPMGYGIYDVRHSPVGPFMIDYTSGPTKCGSIATKITLRVQDLDIDKLAFVDSCLDEDKQIAPDFIAMRNLIGTLKTRPSAMSYNEALDKFEYFLCFPYARNVHARKSVYAHVVCYLIREMKLMGLQNTTVKAIKNREPNGYEVSVRFPGGVTQVLKVFDGRSKFQEGYDAVWFEIPGIELPEYGFNPLFDNHGAYPNKMVYDCAKQYLDELKSDKPLTPVTENFGCFGAEFRRLMRKVINARQKAKTK